MSEAVYTVRGYVGLRHPRQRQNLALVRRGDRWLAIDGEGWEFPGGELGVVAQLCEADDPPEVILVGEDEIFEFYPAVGECERIGLPVEVSP